MNQVAQNVIDAIEKYIQETSKTDYVLDLEEQLKLQREIQILDKHIGMLIDYEAKREQ